MKKMLKPALENKARLGNGGFFLKLTPYRQFVKHEIGHSDITGPLVIQV